MAAHLSGEIGGLKRFNYPAIAKDYWVAVKHGESSDLEIFGPSTAREAFDIRDSRVAEYSPTAKISRVFAASSRGQAESNAKFYLPND